MPSSSAAMTRGTLSDGKTLTSENGHCLGAALCNERCELSTVYVEAT